MQSQLLNSTKGFQCDIAGAEVAVQVNKWFDAMVPGCEEAHLTIRSRSARFGRAPRDLNSFERHKTNNAVPGVRLVLGGCAEVKMGSDTTY